MRLLFATVFIATVIGFLIAMILTLTKEDGLMPNKIVFKLFDVIINLIHSFPFLILMVSLVPVTRFIMGTSIGERAAIFPLTVSMAPSVARLIFSHMDNVNKQLVEVAQSSVAMRYGYSNFNDKIMYSTVLLVILVQIIQLVGDYIYKKVK